MATKLLYSTSDRFLGGEVPPANRWNNNVFDLHQAEFLKRDALFSGWFAAPTLTQDTPGAKIDGVGIDCMVEGNRVTNALSWSFAGKTAGVYYLLVSTGGNAAVNPTPQERTLIAGAAAWDGSAFTDLITTGAGLWLTGKEFVLGGGANYGPTTLWFHDLQYVVNRNRAGFRWTGGDTTLQWTIDGGDTWHDFAAGGLPTDADDGDTIYWDDYNGVWIAGAPGGLPDGVNPDDMLLWDATSGATGWVAAPKILADGANAWDLPIWDGTRWTPMTLAQPADGAVLGWDAYDQGWTPQPGLPLGAADGDVPYWDDYNGVWIAGAPVGPAGANEQVQFNDNGVFGVDAYFTVNKTTHLVTVSALACNGILDRVGGIANAAIFSGGAGDCWTFYTNSAPRARIGNGGFGLYSTGAAPNELWVWLKAPVIAADYTLTLPDALPTIAGSPMVGDLAGALTWGKGLPTTPDDGDTIYWDEYNAAWIAGAPPSGSVPDGVNDGDMLYWDAYSGAWVPGAAPSGATAPIGFHIPNPQDGDVVWLVYLPVGRTIAGARAYLDGGTAPSVTVTIEKSDASVTVIDDQTISTAGESAVTVNTAAMTAGYYKGVLSGVTGEPTGINVTLY